MYIMYTFSVAQDVEKLCGRHKVMISNKLYHVYFRVVYNFIENHFDKNLISVVFGEG